MLADNSGAWTVSKMSLIINELLETWSTTAPLRENETCKDEDTPHRQNCPAHRKSDVSRCYISMIWTTLTIDQKRSLGLLSAISLFSIQHPNILINLSNLPIRTFVCPHFFLSTPFTSQLFSFKESRTQQKTKAASVPAEAAGWDRGMGRGIKMRVNGKVERRQQHSVEKEVVKIWCLRIGRMRERKGGTKEVTRRWLTGRISYHCNHTP